MLKQLVYLFIYYTGIIYVLRYLYRKIYHNPIKIYYAHGIISEQDELYHLMKKLEYLTVDEFEQRVKYLHKHYKFLSLEEGVEYLRKGERPSNCLVLTFDDGYKCIYKEAWPILKKYKIPFTVFITTGPIGGQALLWYDKLLFMIGKTKVSKFKVPDISNEIFLAANDDEKKETFNAIVKYLKRVDNAVMEKIIEDIRKTLEVSEKEIENNQMMLNWDEIREMHEAGLVTFGAHTVNHPILTQVDMERAVYEIQESKRIIEKQLGVTVKSFAYPNGDYNTKIENVVSTSGFNYACTTMEENEIKDFSPYIIGRAGFSYEPFYIFCLRMSGIYGLIHWAGYLFRHMQYWLPGYVLGRIRDSVKLRAAKGPTDVYVCLCDHFEPLGGGVSYEEGLRRVTQWVEKYPLIADKYKDDEENIPKYSFFFPIEEYEEEYLKLLAGLCRQGYGEVEIHLHHDQDTPENLRRQLNDFKTLLAGQHKLLSSDQETKEIKYGFIHGNWALDNSRPDGRWCGVNNELQILQETGCYADFTMPSAPDITQTKIINRIYYAIDDPGNPKSHNRGVLATKGKSPEGLLIVQGPLMLNWHSRRWGIFPKIENGMLSYDFPISIDRIKLWLKANIHVKNAPAAVFIKIYTHGCQERNMEYLLHGGLDNLYTQMKDIAHKQNLKLHYVSAREMVNVIKAIENNEIINNRESMKNSKLVQV